MSNSLVYAGMELLSGAGGTYNIIDGKRGLGDPQTITSIVRSQLTSGAFVTGALSGNRTIIFDILVSATNRLALSQASSSLLAAVNSPMPQTLAWTPDGCPATVFDTFRGQATTTWSGKMERSLLRVIHVEMQALPFGRSDIQRTISGSSASIQLGNFAQATQYSYKTPVASLTPSYTDPYSATPSQEDAVDAIMTAAGTAHGIITSPAAFEGSGSMQVDGEWFSISQSSGTYYGYWGAHIGPITAGGPWNISTMATLQAAVYNPGSYAQATVWLHLVDGASVSQTIKMTKTNGSGVGWWVYTLDTSLLTINLATLTSWTMTVYMGQTLETSLPPALAFYIGQFRAYPISSAQAATTYGAVYKYANVLGDAQAPASLSVDRGGTSTISGALFYKAPPGTPQTAVSLLGLSGSAGTTTAPSTLEGTYRVILANGGGTNIAAGGTLTVTQKVGATTVATATLTASTVAGGSKWADCGDLTLPLVDTPGQVSNVTYTFSFSATATDLIFADTRGFLAWIPVLATAKPYVWADAATAEGMGDVYAGTAADRSDATSLLGATGAQISGAASLDPGDNYLLAYCIDGAFTNVAVDYYDRYLGERTAA